MGMFGCWAILRSSLILSCSSLSLLRRPLLGSSLPPELHFLLESELDNSLEGSLLMLCYLFDAGVLQSLLFSLPLAFARLALAAISLSPGRTLLASLLAFCDDLMDDYTALLLLLLLFCLRSPQAADKLAYSTRGLAVPPLSPLTSSYWFSSPRDWLCLLSFSRTFRLDCLRSTIFMSQLCRFLIS